MLKSAVRREFDMLAVWSSDRLGRSVPHLVEVLQTIRTTGMQLYIHSQALDTTMPSGRAMFQMLAVFGEFERELIVARVNAGLDRARREGKRLGRPGLTVAARTAAIDALRRGASVRQHIPDFDQAGRMEFSRPPLGGPVLALAVAPHSCR